jgi:hypothetical protein
VKAFLDVDNLIGRMLLTDGDLIGPPKLDAEKVISAVWSAGRRTY